MNQSFIIEGLDYGTTYRNITNTHGESHLPFGEVFICPCCGNVWAKATIDNQPYSINSVPCRDHYTYCDQVPGSLIIGTGNDDFTRALPPEVLKRELFIHLDYFEKRGQNV